MEPAPHVKRGITRQLSGESPRRNGKLAFRRNLSFNPRLSNAIRFNFGRQSSLDPKRGSRSPCEEVLTVPGNLDSTMQLLFLACQGDAKGVEELLKDGVDVNSIDLDGRTALHIAACEAEGHADVVKMLLSWRVNVDARDRWGSTVAGFGLVSLTKTLSGKTKLANRKALIDNLSVYMAPEVYRDEILDTSVDIFSFGLILYEMIEGVPAFHPKGPEAAVRIICLEGMRPPFKNKSKSYPPELKELIEECWDPRSVVRPAFSEIVTRLDKIAATCAKQGTWKGTFKLPWKL